MKRYRWHRPRVTIRFDVTPYLPELLVPLCADGRLHDFTDWDLEQDCSKCSKCGKTAKEV